MFIHNSIPIEILRYLFINTVVFYMRYWHEAVV